MRLEFPRPRSLPATICAMVLLLLVKSVSLVQAATGAPRTADGGAAEPGGAMAPAGAGEKSAPASAMQQGQMQAPAPNGAASNGSGPQTPMAAGGAAGGAVPAPVSEAERGLLLDLRKRREVLDARARELDAREAVMAAANQKLAARVAELNALQAKLQSLEDARHAHDDANWVGLVKVYEAMKPRDAAAIFDSLDMQVLLAVLDRMSARKAAPVLAAMQPDRARLATQMLAEFRTRAVTPASEKPSQPDPKG